MGEEGSLYPVECRRDKF